METDIPYYTSAPVRSTSGSDYPGRVTEASATRLETGEIAPAFTLRNQNSRAVSLADFAGERIILFAYPAAMTPGCTKEACDFRDSRGPLKKAGYAILGISPDAPAKLRDFRARDELDYPLLSDPDHAVLAAYGAWGPKSLYGKEVTGVIRSTFVIDADGRIAHALYNVRATGHVARLRTLLEV